MNESDRRLLEGLCQPPYEIPALSASVVRVLGALDDVKAGAQDVADTIAADPSLTARILSIANSSAYNPLGQPCDELRDAVSRVGREELRGLVVATGVVDAFSRIAGPFSQSAFWKHSLMTAVAAGSIAARAHKLGRSLRPGENPYFIGGLLHDIGMLGLIWFRGVDYVDVLDSAQKGTDRLVDYERRAFGANHAEVGGALLRIWGLPDHLAYAVQHHHDPLRAKPEFRSWAHVVHLAEWIADQEDSGVMTGGQPNSLDHSVWSDLGLHRDELPELIAEFHAAAEHAETLLRLIKS